MLLDPVIQSKLDHIVSAWVKEDRMFTAFEVSLQVKEQDVHERHRHLREHVHESIFRFGGPRNYTRTLMDVGAPEQAWVYHPVTTDPYRYRPLHRDGYHPAADDPTVVYTGRSRRGLI